MRLWTIRRGFVALLARSFALPGRRGWMGLAFSRLPMKRACRFLSNLGLRSECRDFGLGRPGVNRAVAMDALLFSIMRAKGIITGNPGITGVCARKDRS